MICEKERAFLPSTAQLFTNKESAISDTVDLVEGTVAREPIQTLVTGAGGFVGSNLIGELIERKIPVRGLVRNEEQAEFVRSLGAEAYIGDIRNLACLQNALIGIKDVYHIAACFRKAGLPDSVFRDTNIQGVKNIFDASIAAGAERIVHCSTIGVHGDIQNPPADESTPYSPGDIYQQTKMEGELLALNYLTQGCIKGAVIRPAMIYGPGDMRTLKLFKSIASGRFFYVGAGTADVHFVDVRDLARAFVSCMEHRERHAEVYIIAGREQRPLRDVAEMIAEYFNVRPPWLHLPVRPMQLLGTACEKICQPLGVQPPIFRRRVDFFTKNRSFSSEKAHQHLGYKPMQGLQEEIFDICGWYVEAGYIRAPQSSRKLSTIVRDLQGNIVSWDVNAEKKYGWNAEQAVGNVSHALLQTVFPNPLSRINEELMKTGRWHGMLVHTTKSGDRIRVASHWECSKVSGQGLRIIERNRLIEPPRNDDEGKRFLGTALLIHQGVAGILQDMVCAMPQLVCRAM